MVHFDNDSFGVYEFPFNTIDVNSGENAPPNLPKFNLGSLRSARVAGEQVEFFGQVTPLRKDGRILVALNRPISSWLILPPSAAPAVLIQSLPSFWLNRFRFTSKSRGLQSENCKLDLAPLLEERQRLREELIQHSQSLMQKAWALRYHRGNLIDALGKLDIQSTSSYYPLICASAEYNALAACIYATLEELTRVFSIFEKIRTGKERSRSFHQLHKNRDAETEQLSLILEGATWYERFRLRRANSTHAFGALVTLDKESTDLYLVQHPDPRIYASSPAPPPPVELIHGEVQDLINGFDNLIEQFSIFLLSLFHPWDLVVLNHADTVETEWEETTVWVRHVVFDENQRRSTDAWVSVNEDGRMAFRTDLRGGLSTA
jgi:hypothetical protein